MHHAPAHHRDPLKARPKGPAGTPPESRRPKPDPSRAPRRTYARPALLLIARAHDLLEALGPAQASYGGSGMP